MNFLGGFINLHTIQIHPSIYIEVKSSFMKLIYEKANL